MASSTSKNRPSRLGRGLSSLLTVPVSVVLPSMSPEDAARLPSTTLPDTLPKAPTSSSQVSKASGDVPVAVETELDEQGGLQHLAIDKIRPNPYQPRQNFDSAGLEQLAQSIRTDGLMQPIVVRPLVPTLDDITHELVAGERRWRAATLAGLTHVPALIRVLTDQQTAEFALIENVQREDLNPLERARAFDQLANQFHLSHETIAQRVGVDRSTVTNLLRLLDLHPDVQELVRQNMLSFGQARALLSIVHPDQQRLLAERAIRGEWSVRQVELATRNLNQAHTPTQDNPPTGKAAHLHELAEHIGQQLGTKVHLKAGRKKGTGTLSIDFYNLDQFDALMQRMNVKTE